MINGGRLKEKIEFFESVLVSDGKGGFSMSEPQILVLSTLGSVRQIKATLVAEAMQEKINAVYEIKIRQRLGFNPTINKTLIWDGKTLEITHVTEDVDNPQLWVITVVSRDIGI